MQRSQKSAAAEVTRLTSSKSQSLHTPAATVRDCISDILILPDGQVLAHSLTPVFTELLGKLNPQGSQFHSREAARECLTQHAPGLKQDDNPPESPHELRPGN